MFMIMDIFLQSLDTKAYVIISSKLLNCNSQENTINLLFNESGFYIDRIKYTYHIYYANGQCNINVEKNIFRNATLSKHDNVGIFVDKKDRLHTVRNYNEELIVDALY